MNIDIDNAPGGRRESFIGPLLPEFYLRIIPHPHSTDPTPRIIPLDSDSAEVYHSNSEPTEVPLREEYGRAPWFPFRSRADFEATEIAVKGLLSTHLTDNLLRGASSTWPSKGRSYVTLKDHTEMEAALASARKYGVKVRSNCHGVSYPS